MEKLPKGKSPKRQLCLIFTSFLVNTSSYQVLSQIFLLNTSFLDGHSSTVLLIYQVVLLHHVVPLQVQFLDLSNRFINVTQVTTIGQDYLKSTKHNF